MKGCFVLQRRFAYLAHAAIVNLKERYGLTEFCGYVFLRSTYDFLRSQKDIVYTSLILDEEIHDRYKNEKLDLEYLSWLEKEFGLPNLWPYIAVDRIVMFDQIVREYPHNSPKYSHEEMLRILQVKAKAVIEFLDREKPDYLFTTQPGGIGSYLLYEIAKKRGIKTLTLIVPSIENKVALSEEYDVITGADRLFERNRKSGGKGSKYYGAAKEYLDSFRNNPRTYSKMHSGTDRKLSRVHSLKFLKPANMVRSVIWILKLYMAWHVGDAKRDYTSIKPWDYIKDHVRRKLRNLRSNRDLFSRLDVKAPYAFFGLHLEPEVSLLLLAPFMADQIYLVKQMARSLPVGYTLYVKDHPHMALYRPRSYYKELLKIPNVKLLDPKMQSYEIIKGADLVFSVTGSVGFEGALLGKPVITLGRAFYNTLPSVSHVRTIDDLPNVVKCKLRGDGAPDDGEILSYLSAIFEDAADGDILYIWEYETDDQKKKAALAGFADLLAKKITQNE